MHRRNAKIEALKPAKAPPRKDLGLPRGPSSGDGVELLYAWAK